jgi:hypothetical protein
MHLSLLGRTGARLTAALLVALVLSSRAPAAVTADTGAPSPVATSTTVGTSGSPSSFGQDVTLTATVSARDAGTPTGTVTFDVDGKPLAAAAVGSAGGGMAAVTTARWSPGTRSVTAIYDGDATYATSASPAVTQEVGMGPTTVSLGASPDRTYAATPATLTARVIPANPIATFSFTSDPGDLVGGGQSHAYGSDASYWQTVNTTDASLQVSAPGDSWAVTIGMPPGRQRLDVGTFTGATQDGSFSRTPLLNVTHNGHHCGTATGSFTITAVDAGSSGHVSGIDAAFEQHCEGAAPALRGVIHMTGLWNPGGFVTFSDGPTVLGTVGVYDHDTATLEVWSLSVGIHSLTASYSGDLAFAPGVSPAISHQVDPRPPQRPTTIDLTTSSNPSVQNQHVTLVAAVSTDGDSSVPTGTVTLRDGGTVLGTVDVDAKGLAVMSTVFTLGGHQLTATYGGDLSHAYAVSAAVGQAVMLATPTRRFVNQLYNDILGRPADNGAASWGTALDNHRVDRTHVALALSTSTEYIGGQVQATYLAHLGREADPQGLEFWVGYIHRGATFEDLETSFLGTPEYYRNAGDTSDTFLTALYMDVFGRDVDADGRRYWDGRLADGTPAWQVAASVVKSAEAMSNRVTDYYRLLLGRDPDVPGRDSWTALLQHGTRDETLLAQLAGSDEYWNLTQSY